MHHADALAAQVGLSSAQVAAAREAGQTNHFEESSSRSIAQIIRGNVFTLFNAIIGVAMVVVLVVGDIQDAVFGMVIVVNAAIGVIQEYRAKRTLDRLSVVNAAAVTVIRDGQAQETSPNDVVLGDWYHLRTGDQIPTDAQVMTTSGLEVDESLLTGESDPVVKLMGDRVMSGSFVVAGSGVVQALAVGPESYAHQLTSAARRFSLVHSELRHSINAILVRITWVIGPVIIALLWSQIRAQGGWLLAWQTGEWRTAVVRTVAGIVGMIPEGLVLLTSISFALAAMVLARQRVLVQELPAVESLARVDMLCLDKTGTLTRGEIEFDAVDLVNDQIDARTVAAVLYAVGADVHANATAAALRDCPWVVEHLGHDTVDATYTVPFSSARKWSALHLSGRDWLFGGADVLLTDSSQPVVREALIRAGHAQAEGMRTLVVAQVDQSPDAQGITGVVHPVALVTFREQVRPDAAETLGYFAQQGVSIKVISGDDPTTVAAIARRVGLHDAVGYDARQLPAAPESLAEVLRTHDVFGRVTPEQKRTMVQALQRMGHTVAMTGDGVNDALALKDADLGIAMGSGAQVTKSVARLVLLDGQFDRLPSVVAQGRRVIANVERVSNLFLTKTTYAMVLAVAISILGWSYPFAPRHMSVVAGLTIGIPAFFLALGPNPRRYLPGFLARVLSFAVPCGLIAASCVLAITTWSRSQGFTSSEVSTVATLTLLWLGLWILGRLAQPWVWWRALLVVAMGLGALAVFAIPFLSSFYALSWPSASGAFAVLVAGTLGSTGIEIVSRFVTPRLIVKLS